ELFVAVFFNNPKLLLAVEELSVKSAIRLLLTSLALQPLTFTLNAVSPKVFPTEVNSAVRTVGSETLSAAPPFTTQVVLVIIKVEFDNLMLVLADCVQPLVAVSDPSLRLLIVYVPCALPIPET